MALQAAPKRILQTLLSPGALTSVLTVSGKAVVIKELTFCNLETKSAEVEVAIVPAGETLGDKHYLYTALETPGSGTRIISGISLVMEENDQLYLATDKALTLYISGGNFVEVL